MDEIIISDVQVLMSNAGYYIGRTYEEFGMSGLPYDRQSDYFPTRKKAEDHLEYLKKHDLI